MARFLLRRTLYSILVLFIVSIVVYLIFFVLKSETPLQRAASFCGKGCLPAVQEATVKRLHLDRPVWYQYVHFLSGLLFHGDLGTDFVNNTPVRSELLSRLPVTLSLAIGAAVIWLLMGVPFGILAATKPRSLRDRAATFFALTFYSIPTFVLGLLLQLVLYFYLTTKLHLRWFSETGYAAITSNPLTWAHFLILPWFTLALTLAAGYSRVTRGSMLDVLGEDYIRTARAKGLTERKVVYKHGLRSALTPVVTILGIDLGVLLGGAIVTERLFGLPGLGAFSLQAVTDGNLPVIVATVLLAAAFIVVANLLVDILYAVLDPRVRLS